MLELLRDHHVPAIALEVIRLCVWLVLVSVVFLPLEWLFAVRPRSILRKSVLGDISYYFISGLIPNLLLAGSIVRCCLSRLPLCPVADPC